MNFDLDDEQRALASAARDFFTSAASPSGRAQGPRRGRPAGPRPRGRWPGPGSPRITVPEGAGGGGGTVLDLAVVAEQAGRVLAGPSLVTSARAAVLLAGDDARLAALADGSVSYAVVDGSSPAIDGATADRFLALVGDTLVEAVGTATVGDPIDPTRGLATVELGETVEIAADARLRWERAERVAQVVLAAEDLGTAARAVEVGIDYAKTREAFGRPIGSYQAVKHALVDAYVGVEQLRSLVWWAAWAADEAPEELPMAAAACKALAATVLEQADRDAHPGARRHRLHLGARRPPVLAAREGRPAAARRRRRRLRHGRAPGPGAAALGGRRPRSVAVADEQEALA